MTRPQFDITIGKDGRVKATVSGASGAACVELADMLRDIVGREDDRRLTPEHYGPDGSVRLDVGVECREETR